MTKEIQLPHGCVALVDDWNYEWLNSYKWQAHNEGYAVRSSLGMKVLMHRFILGLGAEDREHVDHVNHDKLDNRECNLRRCSNAENTHNQKAKGGSSRFKGVYWNKAKRKWRAQIKFGGKEHNLGNFSSEEDAAVAYDRAAVEHFGEFACTNISMGLFSA